MNKDRLEAFSDGVIAIIITVMVLELRTPQGTDPAALRPLSSVFLSYVLSFINLGIYWNNHHHLLQAVERVSGRVLWANLHLLFWLSLLPFATAWMGENNFAMWPVALYGMDLLLAAVAYFLLVRAQDRLAVGVCGFKGAPTLFRRKGAGQDGRSIRPEDGASDRLQSTEDDQGCG